MIVIVAMGSSAPSDGQGGRDGRRGPARDDRVDRRGEIAEAGEPALIGEPEPASGPARGPVERRVLGLGEVDQPAVVAEVGVAQLGVGVQAERREHEPVHVAGQEIGQVERAELLVLEALEGLAAGVELVAVGAGQALDALLADDVVEQAAGAAVGVGDEDAIEARAAAPDALADRLGDATGPVVEGRRQARERDVRQVAGQRHELAGEGPAADDEDARRGVRARDLRPGRGHVARR
jgi:hypothetical protein